MIKIASKNISKLNLSNTDLREFPLEILELRNLKKLNLSGNKISEIPKEIIKLRYLKNLDLSNNQISNFQSKICGLKNLRVLNFNNNSIRTIPKQINQLEKLELLQIANNQIKKLPTEIGEITQLKELNISNNNIEQFPLEIINLQNLKYLWINNLCLHNFPTIELSNLINLKGIYCFGLISSPNLDKHYLELSRIKGNSLAKLRLFSKLNSLENSNSTRQQNNDRKKIFISYSHKDLTWLNEVQTNLKVLHFNDYDFEVWDDTRLKGSEKWFIEISQALEKSDIAILLVSTSFLASEFIRNEELPKLINIANNRGAKILPLIVRPCRFTKDKHLSIYQAVNDPSKALSSLTQPEWENELVNLTNVVADLLIES